MIDEPLDTVYWGVGARSSRGNTRPELFFRELHELGFVDDETELVNHGKRDASGRLNRNALLPSARSTGTRGQAVLSPVFLGRRTRDAVWIDLYDDWSLAPDINPYYRGLAAFGYRNLRRGGCPRTVITVNSTYMQDKLLPRKTHLVPNGIDPRLSRIALGNQTKPRLIVLGHFFRGRTNFRLLDEIAVRPEFEQVIVCGPGKARTMAKLLKRLSRQLGARLVVHEWLDQESLAVLAGPRTVALIPNLVRDYTLSQDPMKAGQMLALGIKVICPRLLWPAHLPKDHVLLLDYGIDLDAVLAEWIEAPGPDTAHRVALSENNSWRVRAYQIAKLIENRPNP